MINIFNFFFKNENKTIRYSSICFLVTTILCITILLVKITINSDEIVEQTTKGATQVVSRIASAAINIASAGVEITQSFKETITLEQEDITFDTNEDYFENWKKEAQSQATETTKITKVIVKNEKAKIKLKNLLEKGKEYKEFSNKLNQLAKSVLSERHGEVDQIFAEVIERTPNFAERHYEDRGNKSLIVAYMQKELIMPQTFEDFYVATAMELDQILYEAVNEELDGYLKELQSNNSSLTLDQLRAKMPTAKQICESIYAKIVSKNIKDKDKSNFNNYISKVGKKYNIDETGALAAVGSTFLVGTGATTAAVMTGNPLLICAVAGISVITTAFTGHSARVIMRDRRQIEEFATKMKEAIIETRDEFKITLGIAVKDILDQYATLDFLRDAEIEVDTSTPVEISIKK